jgi:hypothetical protein
VGVREHGLGGLVVSIVDPDFLREFLADHGAELALDPAEPTSAAGIAACWDQHPAAVTDLTGIALAWTALIDAFDPPRDGGDLQAAIVVPAPRDWLDLTNATTPARDRIKAVTSTCVRAGHHIAPVRTS